MLNKLALTGANMALHRITRHAGSESRPPMLNKESYVPWLSRLLCYAKSRQNGKLIHNSIINGPYVRQMIPEPGDTNREVPVTKTFHVQTDDELTEKELKQIEADDQAIQTILLSLPEDIYAAVDSYETAQEIWLRKEVDELKVKLLAKIHDPLALMENFNTPYAFPTLHQDQPSFNQNYMQQLMPNPEDITDPTTTMNIALTLMAKAFNLNYSTPTNNNQRISSNLRNRQIAQPGINMGQDRKMKMVGGNSENQLRQYVGQNVRNLNGLIGVPRNTTQNLNGNGNLVVARTEGNVAGLTGNQIRCYNCRGVEEFDLMAAVVYLDEIEEVNANCILMANLQQASTSGTQTDKALVNDSDGSAEVHDYENCDDNEIFNMFTQEEQYTKLLEPIPDQHQVPQNHNNVISKLEKKIKELNNILVKMGQSIQTIHMLSPKPDLFYHTEQKMALGYQNPFYLKQAQKKQQSLYDEKVLLEKHDPPVVHDSEKTLQVAQETKFVGNFKSLAKEADASLAKHKALELKIERLLRAVVSQDIISIMQKESINDTSDLQTELEHTKERFENYIIKKRMNMLNFGMIVTSISIRLPQESSFVKNDKVVAPGMFRINPFKTSREENRKDVNSDSNGLSSTRVDNTKTIRPHPRSNTKNVRVLSVYESSQKKNKEAEVEEHHRNLLLSKNNKHMSLACNIIKLDSHKVISKVVCAMCKQCLIFVNHDVCLHNYVNGKTSRYKKQKANVSIKEKQKKHQPKVKKTKKVGFIERLVTPRPRKSRFFLRWSPTGRRFDPKGCFKCITRNLKLLIYFVWKFMGTVRFRNDHVAAIMGFGDLQWRSILIARVYFIEGLGHNLFSVGQFCDSDLEVAFRRNACFIKNLDGVDLLKRDYSTNLYTINLHEMASALIICLMARASSTKLWLWHQRLSHLNFDTINDLARNDLVSGLLKFKYHKEHLCPLCEQGKSKRAPHPPKPVSNSRQRLHLIHMDLCGPMRISSINGKRYVLVIVDDYSRYMWIHFLRSKDEAPDKIITFLKRITVLLQSPVIIIRSDNGSKFKNHVLKEYFDCVGISHRVSSIRTPQQNGVVERRNWTLVEADRIMLIFSHAPLFLGAEEIATAALCYPKNDREDIGKCGTKGFIDADHPSHVYKLKKTLYGLKEEPRAWYDELSTFLLENHFFKGTIYSTLLIRRFHDDILVPIPLWHLYKPVQIRVRNPKKYGMESCDPVGTPMEIKDKLDLDQNGTPFDATKYHSMIGALMYLTSSRPDIVHATCLCARYQAKPTEKHFKETPSKVLPVELNSKEKSLLAGPQRRKTIRRCQSRKKNMCLYLLVVPKSFGCGHS
uniref:Putative ribonuclease H-like domain-containing protein n=1 Tax=Tanacetum cinerariifolium TaxID=118510 RepID=A0A699GK95_TANCI|nr:putative ribonuclease H-like domain-containing protein [Tanacetum cinerariifolium]